MSMTLKDHIKTADDLAIAYHHLKKVFKRCQHSFCKSSKIMRLLMKVHPNNIGGFWGKVKCELDDNYHQVVTDDEFSEYGHVYYNYEERYEKLKQKNRKINKNLEKP